MLAVSVKKDGQEVDHLVFIFGIRSVELKAGQMILNGEFRRLVGVTCDADSPQFGLAELSRSWQQITTTLKIFNEVLSRPVHYPQAEFILDYADRHGILLIPEIPAWQLTALQMSMPKMQALEKQQLRENYLMRSTTIQPFGPGVLVTKLSWTPEGHTFVKEMLAYVKSLDPTRPVGFASNRLNSNPETGCDSLLGFCVDEPVLGWLGWSQTRPVWRIGCHSRCLA